MNKVFICLHVKDPLFLSDFNNSLTFSTDFRKILNIRFHENPSSGSRVVSCERTDMTKLIVAFAILRTCPKNCHKNTFF